MVELGLVNSEHQSTTGAHGQIGTFNVLLRCVIETDSRAVRVDCCALCFGERNSCVKVIVDHGDKHSENDNCMDVTYDESCLQSSSSDVKNHTLWNEEGYQSIIHVGQSLNGGCATK